MPGDYTKTQIDRTTPIPLYFQISQILRRDIEGGKYKQGENIPTEAELQKYFSVSRATIRQAISELVYSGLLERNRSQGTKVSTGTIEATLESLASFTNEMRTAGLNLSSKILSFKLISPPEGVAKTLELCSSDKVAAMERVRSVDEKPIAVERWYASLQYFPDIDRKMFSESGMEQSTYYILMKHYDVKISRAEDTVSSVGVETREAKLLGVEPGHPVLLRTRISYSMEDRPILYAYGVYLIHLKFSLVSTR